MGMAVIWQTDQSPSQSREALIMKYSVAVLVAIFGVVAAQQRFTSTQAGNEIVITRSENENNGDGTFRWVSELSDGTKLEQSGYTKASGDPENPVLQVIQGGYSYYSPEGELIQLSYNADENGFQPQGAHLPTPPPVPEAIQRSIDLINRNIQAQPQQQQQQQFRPQQQQRYQPRFP